MNCPFCGNHVILRSEKSAFDKSEELMEVLCDSLMCRVSENSKSTDGKLLPRYIGTISVRLLPLYKTLRIIDVNNWKSGY